MLSNPPYGTKWKKDKEAIEPKKGEIIDARFEAQSTDFEGNPETIHLTPRIGEGQLLFLVNMLRKMKTDAEMGSRLATVHSGSALFTGNAGQGMSEIRRWILENDWLEAIIGLPKGMFYNTGINTYVWVLTNRKKPHRRGRVQLIDATDLYKDRRRNLGDKSRKLAQRHIRDITEAFLDSEETERSKIFDNEDFGYYNIVVERPERRLVQISDERVEAFTEEHPDLTDVAEHLRDWFGKGVHDDFNAFRRAFKQKLKEADRKTYKKDRTAVYDAFSWIDEDGEAAPVRTAGTLDAEDEADAVYEPDTDLRDRDERVPMQAGEDARDTIQRYFEEEIASYVPDAWIDWDDVRIGYEINFTRHFYQYEPPRPLDEIAGDIRALEDRADGLLNQIVEAA
jgi:type I restriction enzyme M protein